MPAALVVRSGDRDIADLVGGRALGHVTWELPDRGKRVARRRCPRRGLTGLRRRPRGAYVATLVFKSAGVVAEDFDQSGHQLSNIIASPDFLASSR